MTKPTKNRYDGVGVFVNGYLLSRVQSVSADTDLGEEEARELTNDQVVEFTSSNPSVTVTIETNEYGSMRNIGAVATVTSLMNETNPITVASFDGTAADIGIIVEEDSVIKRTAIMNDSFITSIAWNFDVGGVATETFTFETDNKEWFANSFAQTYSLVGVRGIEYTTTGLGAAVIPLAAADAGDYTGVKVYIDGIAQTGSVAITGMDTMARAVWYDDNQASGTRYRVLIRKDTVDTTIPQATSTSTIGSIPRGKLDIHLASGGMTTYGTLNTTNMLRLQSTSIDADLSREVLNELGHFRAYDRSLTLPIPVNITFSALASDLEEWAKFSNKNFSNTVITSFNITEFTKDAGLQVRMFDKQDTDLTRALLKTLTVTGLQVVSESYGIDAGGNGTQDYTVKASNFNMSGLGFGGDFPLDDAPTA